MDIWITRDFDGRLFMHFHEPTISTISGKHWQSYPYMSMISIDNTPIASKFKNLKFEDSPVKIKLKI